MMCWHCKSKIDENAPYYQILNNFASHYSPECLYGVTNKYILRTPTSKDAKLIKNGNKVNDLLTLFI